MLAHYHGQTWTSSEISRSLGVSDKTVRSYLDVLTQTFMVRQVCPWFENVAKRQVKARASTSATPDCSTVFSVWRTTAP